MPVRERIGRYKYTPAVEHAGEHILRNAKLHAPPEEPDLGIGEVDTGRAQKQYIMMELVLAFYDRSVAALEKGAPPR